MDTLQWIKENEQLLLKSGDETLVEVSIEKCVSGSVKLNGLDYQIQRKGFWNPLYMIEQGEKNILKLTHSFWGSNGKIIFEDGSVYKTAYTNKNGLGLQFFQDDQLVLEYGTVYKDYKPGITFRLGITEVDGEKILILAALGMFIFSNLFRENISSDDMTSVILLAAI